MKRKWEHVFSSDFILKLYEYICFTGHRGLLCDLRKILQRKKSRRKKDLIEKKIIYTLHV